MRISTALCQRKMIESCVPDYGDQTISFRLNEAFTVDRRDSFSDLGIVEHLCTRPQQDLLVCTTFDPGESIHHMRKLSK